MTPIEFLKSVWPTDGLYCIAVPLKVGYDHKVFETIDEAAAYVESVKDDKDVFFCVHSLKEPRIWNPSKGESGGWSVRLQSNMQEASAFFFDLDVGDDDKKYATQVDALKALIKFCKDAKLPTPTVTSSGGGLHVYWLITPSVQSNTWRAYASQLKKLAQVHGLKADPARTTDTSSVLRVVGTFNHKRGEKRPVKVIKQGVVTEFDDFLKRLNAATIRAGEQVAQPKEADEYDKYFGGGNLDRKRDYGEPPHILAVLKECRLMRALNDTRATHDQTTWYNSLGVTVFCADGVNVSHKWSKPHPGYTPAGTEAKIQQWLPLAPVSCKVLAEKCGAELCAGCPHLNKNSNPIRLAQHIDAAPAPVIQVPAGPAIVELHIPDPPKPYTRTKSGGISMRNTNKEGEEFHHVIYGHDLFPIRRMRNGLAGIEQHLWRVVHPKDGPTDFVIDADAFYDRKKFATSVAHAGIYAQPDDLKGLQNYMVAYIAELQRQAAAEAQATHLGWSPERDAFTLSDKIIYANGTVKPVTLSGDAATYSEPLHKRGTLERQIELLEFYNHPAYIPNQFVILAGLGAAVFGMTGQHGAIINCTGKAGASKSTTIYTAAALWGDPEKYTINGTKRGDTANRRDAKTSVLSNLPICVDEISSIGLDEAYNMAMGVSQSESRGRLKRNGTAQKTLNSEKSTLVLSTANDSLHDTLSARSSTGAAASMRVFEIAFTNQIIHKKWEADEYLDELKHNYGHIGEIFIQAAVQEHTALKQRVRTEMKLIDQEASITPGERFYSSVGAAVLEVGRWAVRNGIVRYDIEAVRKWLIEVQIPFMRGVVVDEYASPAGVLTDYLEAISGNTLVVQKIKGAGIVNILKKPMGQMLAHYDYDDKTLIVLRKGFKDYCAKIGANFLTIIEELHAAKIDINGNRTRLITNKNIKKVMGAGTEFGKAQAWCFIMDLKHPDCLGIPDLTLVENPSVTVTPPKGKLRAVDED